MPIYEFKCLGCCKDFERLVMGSSNSIICPHCGSESVERQMSRFGFKVGKSTGTLTEQAGSGSSCSSCATHNCSQCH